MWLLPCCPAREGPPPLLAFRKVHCSGIHEAPGSQRLGSPSLAYPLPVGGKAVVPPWSLTSMTRKSRLGWSTAMTTVEVVGPPCRPPACPCKTSSNIWIHTRRSSRYMSMNPRAGQPRTAPRLNTIPHAAFRRSSPQNASPSTSQQGSLSPLPSRDEVLPPDPPRNASPCKGSRFSRALRSAWKRSLSLTGSRMENRDPPAPNSSNAAARTRIPSAGGFNAPQTAAACYADWHPEV